MFRQKLSLRVRALWYLLLCSLGTLLQGCATTLSPVQLDISEHPSENQNQRVRFVVLHYTAGNWQQSFDILTQKSARPVSSHYLIPESFDNTYPEQKLKVYQLVPESARAWHAGESAFEDRQNLNDQSIGIELVNTGHCDHPIKATATSKARPALCLTPDFDPQQMQLLALLLKDILKRYPDISPSRVLAHSDIAPAKKQDPGPRFPWQWLASQGIGAWYDNHTVRQYYQQPVLTGGITQLQQALRLYGYAIQVTGQHDDQSRLYFSAFQRHFVPEQISGEADDKSIAVLSALLAKYRPDAFLQLIQQTAPAAGLCPMHGTDKPGMAHCHNKEHQQTTINNNKN
ncbi:N-acetylmuramoyl-L-alanine amidase [Rheinheimera sp.]|uniref:N-acetylmuramoyl-L-alanine amidase n=1 Tax=Rheinheimera sp. TaxID=1869214 RepID=UPI002FDDCB4E